MSKAAAAASGAPGNEMLEEGDNINADLLICFIRPKEPEKLLSAWF